MKPTHERDPPLLLEPNRSRSSCYLTGRWLIAFAITGMMIPLTSARISQSACYRNDCVQKNDRLQFCYYPSDKHDPGRYPACRDATLKKLVDTHIGAAAENIPTIAYYDLDTQKFLGGQLYSVAETQRTTRVAICQTGLVQGDEFYTACRITRRDNDFGSPEAHKGGCGKYHAHDERVLKERCCGFPRAVCPPSHESWRYRVTAGDWKERVVVTFVGLLTLITLLLRG